ncbi:hypothetical protein [uncultured Helcococcus sp.]|uniref:hypothetical protein n=1 Tax=uncultured Helcococcus sp. TaxID=1072508 RepID=UPI0026165255|nr:hypothetical protein [uncultured Helcococcus sp.]
MNKSIVRKIAALLLALSLVVSAGASSIFAAGEVTEAQKTEAKEKLKSIEGLSEEALNDFVKQVEEADSVDAIEEILGEAGYFDERPEVDPLAKQKAEAKEKLKSIEGLSEEALNDFVKQVEEADSVDAIEEILGEAGYFNEETEDENPGVPLTPMFPAEEDEDEDEDETSIPLTPLTPAEEVEESKDETSEESKEETTEESKDKNDKKDGTTVTSTEKNPGTSDMGIALSAITLLTSAGAYVFTSKKKEDK